jgi:pseudouridine synthase
MSPEPIRLQKFLSQSGISSRREGERLMLAGRVAVNGRTVRELGVRIRPGEDRVTVNGREICAQTKIYLLLNKPPGYLCSLEDRCGRRLVTDLVRDIAERLYPVGRLDYNSEGLLILSNDGILCQKLTHPSHEISKTYLVETRSPPGPEELRRLRAGVVIGEGIRTLPARVKMLRAEPPLLEITIREGRNRQIRRMLEAVGNRVVRLRRVALGPLSLGRLEPGKFRALSEEEVRKLYAAGETHCQRRSARE